MIFRKAFCQLALAVLVAAGSAHAVQAQGPNFGPRVDVNQSVDSIELIAGSSKKLKFGYDIPELLVENPEILSATPMSTDEILIKGIKPGISSITIADANQNLQVLTVEVMVDVRKLERALASHFPDSQVKVSALNSSVLLKGNVARADQVENIVAVARDYFPTNVINELHVNGSQNIAIKVKVYEVSRTKLREFGFDWSFFGDDVSVVSSVADLIQSVSNNAAVAANDTISLGVLNDGNQFNAFIRLLERNSVAKLLDQPVLVAQNGRPAEFLSGGEIPIQVASGLGNNSIEFRPFGTKLDLVPIVHGQGQLTLEVRAEVSEIANDLSGNTGVPGFRVRRVNTGVKMKAGHTLALAGDYREDVQAEKQGIPKLMDHPIWGIPFRKVLEEKNETELVFLITPRFISEVEPHLVPPMGVGQLTGSPSDRELLINAHLEVPKCGDDCPINDRFDAPNYNPNPNLLPGPNGMQQGVQMNFQGGQPTPPAQSSYYQQPSAVQPKLRSAFKFPWSKKETAKPAAQQAQGNAGFSWPKRR